MADNRSPATPSSLRTSAAAETRTFRRSWPLMKGRRKVKGEGRRAKEEGRRTKAPGDWNDEHDNSQQLTRNDHIHPSSFILHPFRAGAQLVNRIKRLFKHLTRDE